ncbi:hypothetical protein HDU96_001281, partial [Phlyctochytrium bullatum]
MSELIAALKSSIVDAAVDATSQNSSAQNAAIAPLVALAHFATKSFDDIWPYITKIFTFIVHEIILKNRTDE